LESNVPCCNLDDFTMSPILRREEIATIVNKAAIMWERFSMVPHQRMLSSHGSGTFHGTFHNPETFQNGPIGPNGTQLQQNRTIKR
jgi:hypothetical protein